MLLVQRTIVLVDPNTETAASLATELRREGARCFIAGDAATAVWGARETLPDAVVVNLDLPGTDAHALVERLRGMPECPGFSSLGLTLDPSLAADGHRRHVALDKYLLRPISGLRVVETLSCVIGLRCALEANTQISLDGAQELVRGYGHGLLLRALNAGSGHRFSAYFRHLGTTLSSVWTFDRERPGVDLWPLDLRTASTPCAAVVASRKPLLIEDIEADPHILPKQRLEVMRAFVGVPVMDESQHVTGVLCHFSPNVVSANPAVRERLEKAARELTPRAPC